MPIPTVVVGDAVTARSVLSDPRNDKPIEFLRTFELILGGTNMFTQPNEKARIMRKHTSRAFAPVEVKNRITDICHKCIDEWIESILEPSIKHGTCIDPCHEMLDVAFRIICQVVFEYKATREECELFLKHGDIAGVEFGFKQMVNPLRPLFGKWLPGRAEAFKSVEWVHAFGMKMLCEFQRKKSQGLNAKDCNTIINIIDSDPCFKTNEEKLPELMLWLFAGHDTTGYSMGIMLLHLAQNKSEMVKVREAISKADESQYINLNEVQNVIKESNRLMSVVASISMRKLGADMTTSDGHLIPKGTTVFLPQHLPNHDPRIYKSPDRFLPDRWNGATKEMTDAHMPFAHGQRSCPGMSLAKAEMGLIIPRLIRDYDFEVVKEGEPKFFVTLKPVGVQLRSKYAAK